MPTAAWQSVISAPSGAAGAIQGRPGAMLRRAERERKRERTVVMLAGTACSRGFCWAASIGLLATSAGGHYYCTVGWLACLMRWRCSTALRACSRTPCTHRKQTRQRTLDAGVSTASIRGADACVCAYMCLTYLVYNHMLEISTYLTLLYLT